MARITIIIPVFNQAALTASCLRALGSTGSEIVVVDDASTDATPRFLDTCPTLLKVVRHDVNQGFATSCNDGFAVATGEYVVFLNNDTIPQPGWLEALVRYADTHPQASVIGSKLVYPNQTIQHAGVVICQDRYPRHIYTGFPREHPAVTKSRRFQIVTAACMLTRRSAFEQARGFDPHFRNGFEDVDLCLRLGGSGHQIHYCAESVVEHLESVSPGRFKYDGDNVALYRERWLGRVQPDDVGYYLQDGLLRLSYEGRYPICLEVSPLLATVDQAGHVFEAGRILHDRSQQVAELSQENTRLRLELNNQTEQSPQLQYLRLREEISNVVQNAVPAGSAILVVSKGDGALLNLPGYRAWHFPQTERGVYAGHHPAGSAEAIAQLEALRASGSDYLLIPATSLWWLDHYAEFRQHLEIHYVRLSTPKDLCALYCLAPSSREASRRRHDAVPKLPAEVLVAGREGSGS